MIRARTIGDRRSRPFTPGSADRPAKVARDSRNLEAESAARVLDYAEASTQQMLESMAGSSSSGGDAEGSDAPATSTEYDTWDLPRYKRAKTERARGHFWANASVESKQRMTQALLSEPTMSPVTVQARQKAWIPF